MPFSTFCNNKGCGKQMEPYLDPNNGKVYCSQCDQEINNLTIFAKNQMKSIKQFRPKQNIPFVVKCQKCNKEAQPLIDKEKVICPSCKVPHSHLSEPFKIMLREKLKKYNSDI